MSANAVHNYHNTCNELAAEIQKLSTLISVSEHNIQLKANNEKSIKTYEGNIILCNGVLDNVKPIVDDVQDYIAERKKESMHNINNALRLAGEIIPDSTEGIYFKLDGDEAWLATPDDLEVQTVEGGGFRQVSSAFLRTVVLNSNPDNLQTVFFDEVFALVSPENSSTLSLYLNVICQNTQVISIEQKPQVYSNIDCVKYLFTKDEDFTTCTRSIVKRGETLDSEVKSES